jgi:hypothetical protein
MMETKGEVIIILDLSSENKVDLEGSGNILTCRTFKSQEGQDISMGSFKCKILRFRFSDEKTCIPLEPDFYKRILRFAQIRYSMKNLNCLNFAYFVAGLSVRRVNHVSYNIITFSEDLFQVGALIVFAESNTKLLHYAIYLGKGQYISKIGTIPLLAICTADELQKIYSFNFFGEIDYKQVKGIDESRKRKNILLK